MAREFVAAHDHVLIERIKVEMTEGGIALPETEDDNGSELRVRSGIVRYVGPGPLLDDGSRAPCQAIAGREVEYQVLPIRARTRKINGVELDVVRDNDIIGSYI